MNDVRYSSRRFLARVRTASHAASRIGARVRWRAPWDWFGGREADRARVVDLYACYRLLLGREPDEAGWTVWMHAIRNGISVEALRDGFLYSAEFVTAQCRPRRPILVELDEFKIYVQRADFFVGAAILRDRTFEPHVTAEVRRLLQPGGVFIDVGANIGYFTLLAAARVGPQGRVVAFEPNPDNCELLAESIRANGFENITVHPYAVGDRPRDSLLAAGGVISNGHILDAPPAAAPVYRRVRVVRADDHLRDLPTVDVVKIDIEGGEPRALRGMTDLVRVHQPVIVSEFSPALIESISGEPAASYLEHLDQLGYVLCILGQDARQTRTAREILGAHASSGLSHLDLIAYPRAAMAAWGAGSRSES